MSHHFMLTRLTLARLYQTRTHTHTPYIPHTLYCFCDHGRINPYRYEPAEGQSSNSRTSLYVPYTQNYGAGEQSLMADDLEYVLFHLLFLSRWKQHRVFIWHFSLSMCNFVVLFTYLLFVVLFILILFILFCLSYYCFILFILFIKTPYIYELTIIFISLMTY